MRKKISQLEASIARIKLERDDLARDVESLCLDDASNTTFNVSSVLNERIFVAEKQVFKLRKELLDCDLERKSLLEDLYSIKHVQQENNALLRKQTDDIDRLQKELSFYKEQSTSAISDRDAMSWEIESLRRDLEAARGNAVKVSTALATVEEERDVLKQRLEESLSMVDRLEKVAATAELLPVLQRNLRSIENKAASLETQVTTLTSERDSLKVTVSQERENAEEKTSSMKKTYEEEARTMKEAIQTRENELQQTRTQLAMVTSQKVQALLDKADAESLASKYEREMHALGREMTVLKQNLETATREKVQALVGRADAEAQLSGSTSKASSLSPSPFTSPVKKRLEL